MIMRLLSYLSYLKKSPINKYDYVIGKLLILLKENQPINKYDYEIGKLLLTETDPRVVGGVP